MRGKRKNAGAHLQFYEQMFQVASTGIDSSRVKGLDDEMINRVKEHRNPLPIILEGFPLDWMALSLKERISRILSTMLQQQ